MGIDATAPFEMKEELQRATYKDVDVKKYDLVEPLELIENGLFPKLIIIRFLHFSAKRTHHLRALDLFQFRFAV